MLSAKWRSAKRLGANWRSAKIQESPGSIVIGLGCIVVQSRYFVSHVGILFGTNSTRSRKKGCESFNFPLGRAEAKIRKILRKG